MTSTLIVLTALLTADVTSAPAVGKEKPSTVVYTKKATRAASWEATLAASGFPVFGPWEVVGPLDRLLRHSTEPEKQPQHDRTYSVLRQKEPVPWAPRDFPDGYLHAVEIRAPKDKRDCTVCLARTVISPSKQTIPIFLGCDTGIVLSINGKEVLYNDTLREVQPGQELAQVPLRPGENRLVLKIALTKGPSRFFFLPDFGLEATEQIVAELDRDFPLKKVQDAQEADDSQPQVPGSGYRERVARMATSAEDVSYPLTEIDVPAGIYLEGGGMDVLPDGRLALCTRRGFVYLVTNPTSRDPKAITFQRFAQGLHEPLGLKADADGVLVMQRSEVTQLTDSDGDDKADRFLNRSTDFGITGNYHEYAYGFAEDLAHNVYFALNLTIAGKPTATAKGRGCVLRLSPDGKTEIVSTGFRSPNGLGENLAGDIFVTDNQGDWVPACPLYHVRPGAHFSHPASKPWLPQTGAGKDAQTGSANAPWLWPAVWFPYEEIAQSASDIACDTTAGKFGPFAGQLFVGDMTKGVIARVALEKVNGVYQGSCFLFRRGCGAINRMAFAPNGSLFLSRCNRGWGGGGIGEGLARVDFTGKVPLEIHSVTALPDGFRFLFTLPLDKTTAEFKQPIRCESYRYEHWQTYGSPKIDIRRHEVQMRPTDDPRTIDVRLGKFEAGRVYQLMLGALTATTGEALLHGEAFYTLNEIPKD